METFGDLIGNFSTWSFVSAERFPTVLMFCAWTTLPRPRLNLDVARDGNICSTGVVHSTKSGNIQSSFDVGGVVDF